MRKFLIDTDTGTDDAVAIIMALRDPDVMVEGITTVCGNVEVEQATQNCLKAVEMAGTYFPPVYQGLSMPILRERVPSSAQGPTGWTGWETWPSAHRCCRLRKNTGWTSSSAASRSIQVSWSW